jgi:hypothetical protein
MTSLEGNKGGVRLSFRAVAVEAWRARTLRMKYTITLGFEIEAEGHIERFVFLIPRFLDIRVPFSRGQYLFESLGYKLPCVAGVVGLASS